MGVTIHLADDEIALIKELTKLQNDADAVSKAAREFLRLRRLQELKSASGNVDFQDISSELETLELSEVNLPQ